MLTILSSPDQYHTIYNPVRFKVYSSLYGSKSLRMKITRHNPTNEEYTFTWRFPEGWDEVEIDISGVLGSLVPDNPPAGDAAGQFTDDRLFVRYSVSFKEIHHYMSMEGEWMDLPSEYCALRAVVQTGATSSMMGYRDRPLTAQHTIYCYDGYPLDVSYLSTAAPCEVRRIVISPTAEGEVAIGDGTAESQFSEIKVSYRNVPPRPFYVRWINRLGGFDYWMFSTSQQFSKGIKKGLETVKQFNDGRLGGCERAFGAEAENTVKVGAENLSSDEFELLSSLGFSPLIEYYDREKSRWFRLIPAKSSAEYLSGETRQEIEMEFDLPETRLQFA